MNSEQKKFPETVEDQKYVAKRLLQILTPIDPNAVVAGGCPRDWWQNKMGNDIDIYMVLPDECEEVNKKRLESVGIYATLMRDGTSGHDSYSTMESLIRIWEFEFMGMEVQIMVLSISNRWLDPTLSPVTYLIENSFGSTVSMIYFDGDKVIPSLPFLISQETKSIYKRLGDSGKCKHIKKMQEYFPDYTIREGTQYPIDLSDVMTRYKMFDELSLKSELAAGGCK